MPIDAVAAVDEIRRNRSHGARWLTRRTAELLLALARENAPGLEQACRSLASAQPAMASLVRLGKEAANAATAAEVEDLCRRTLAELERDGRAAIDNAAALIADGATILTHSHSSTVEAALLLAHTQAKRLRVIAAESLPLGEGRQLADTLCAAGVDVALIADSAAAEHMGSSSLVMVGADAVTPAGVINKIGTAALARMARDSGLPFYVICTSDKISDTNELVDPEHLFDITPRELITAIVTERRTARFRFDAALDLFLRPERRGRAFEHPAPPTDTLLHVIESLGVPHTEIGNVTVGGSSAALHKSIPPGSEIHVGARAAEPLADTRFVLDGHLGRLAAYLRMLGFDTLYDPAANDASLADISARERRMLLTRDTGLLKRSEVSLGYFVRATNPLRQLAEVAERCRLLRRVAPFTRCLCCNAVLEPAEKAEVAHRLPPRVREQHDEFARCPSCDRVYWKGTHYARMAERIRTLAH